MTFNDYKFVIDRGDVARDLHELDRDISADDVLDADEKFRLRVLIDKKFSQLNARAAAGHAQFKPRWQT